MSNNDPRAWLGSKFQTENTNLLSAFASISITESFSIESIKHTSNLNTGGRLGGVLVQIRWPVFGMSPNISQVLLPQCS